MNEEQPFGINDGDGVAGESGMGYPGQEFDSTSTFMARMDHATAGAFMAGVEQATLMRGYGAIGAEVQALLATLAVAEESMAGLAAAAHAARAGMTASRHFAPVSAVPGSMMTSMPAQPGGLVYPAGAFAAERGDGRERVTDALAGAAISAGARPAAPPERISAGGDGYGALVSKVQALLATLDTASAQALMSLSRRLTPVRGARTFDFEALERRGAASPRLPGELAGAVFPAAPASPNSAHHAWSAWRDGHASPMSRRQQEADVAVLPRPAAEQAHTTGAFPRGLSSGEWLREAAARAAFGAAGAAGKYAAAARDGQARLNPAPPALPLFPSSGTLSLPPPAAASSVAQPIRLEVTVKAGQDFTAEVTQLADQRIELVVLPALRRVNR